MRIEAHVYASGREMTDAVSLAQKLDTGDVLRAMVLEITSDEVLLRLSGGGVLKAKAMETVSLKAGQFVELVVISKEGNTLLLETAHNRHMTAQQFDSETLSDFLVSLNIKPDNLNILLATELIKNGIPVTRSKMDEAHRLIKNFTGLDVEKAAFLLSSEQRETEAARQITSMLLTAEAEPELLAKLLGGELKLGQLIEEIQNMTGNKGAEEAGNYNEASEDGVFAAASGNTLKESAQDHGKEAAGTRISETGVNNINDTGEGSILKTVDSDKETVYSGTEKNPGATTEKVAGTEEYVTGASYKTEDLHGKPAVNNTDGTPAGNTGSTFAFNTGSIYKRPDNLAGYAEHLFLKIEGDRLEANPAVLSENPGMNEKNLTGAGLETITAENDVSGAQKDLAEALGDISSSILQNVKYTPARAETISGAFILIGSTIKLINEINHIGIPYLQLPVNINGYKTTAELFVMKRNKGGKRIDPNNLVMYVSLDTKNMGRVETILDVKGKNIDLRLRTEKQQISDYFRENIDQLYASFSECGYKLSDVRYTVIDSATPPSRLKKLILGLERTGWRHGRVDLRV
ncbi:MAG: flagellar hook-length control protein FliK [Acetivibrionales bacterium]|jgi:transcriptional antiterminator Rof (Rho-off)